MKRVYFEICNPSMRRFLGQAGLFEVSTQKDAAHDLLFCDSLAAHDPAVRAEKKVYLGCSGLEKILRIEQYQDFEYYIGFGKRLHDGLETHGFYVSKILDGFVRNEDPTAYDHDGLILLNTARSDERDPYEIGFVYDVLSINVLLEMLSLPKAKFLMCGEKRSSARIVDAWMESRKGDEFAAGLIVRLEAEYAELRSTPELSIQMLESSRFICSPTSMNAACHYYDRLAERTICPNMVAERLHAMGVDYKKTMKRDFTVNQSCLESRGIYGFTSKNDFETQQELKSICLSSSAPIRMPSHGLFSVPFELIDKIVKLTRMPAVGPLPDVNERFIEALNKL